MKFKLLLGFFVFLIGCKQTNEYKTATNGVQYQFLGQKNVGEKPKYGDIVSFQLKYGNDKTLLFDSYKNKQPVFKQITRPAFFTSFERGLELLAVGDSAVFVCSADSVFELLLNTDRPTEIPAGSQLKFWVKMLEIRDENQEIAQTLSRKGITEKPDATGLILVTTKPGKGPNASSGDSLTVHYRSFLLNGTEIENSYQSQPLRFVLGMGSMIDAWEIALPKLNQGAKATIVCPSYLCYAAKRKDKIAPFTPLIFEIELLKIKKK